MKLYTQQHCRPCTFLRDTLSSLDIEFEEEPIGPENVERIKAAGLLAAPVLEKDGEFLGFGDALRLLKAGADSK